MLLVQQRDEYSAKLSAAEDKESRNEAALINLQCALEQFQKSMLIKNSSPRCIKRTYIFLNRQRT